MSGHKSDFFTTGHAHVCVYVCIYVCVYICVCVCMCVCVLIINRKKFKQFFQQETMGKMYDMYCQ